MVCVIVLHPEILLRLTNNELADSSDLDAMLDGLRRRYFTIIGVTVRNSIRVIQIQKGSASPHVVELEGCPTLEGR